LQQLLIAQQDFPKDIVVHQKSLSFQNGLSNLLLDHGPPMGFDLSCQ